MYAVIRDRSKQYRVSKGDVVSLDLREAKAGETIELNEVTMVGDGADLKIGAPTIKGAKVTAQVLENYRDRKVMAYKFRRRKSSRARRGHRQSFTRVKITDIKA